MTHRRVVISTAAMLLATTTLASAQDQSNGAQSSGQNTPDRVTCAQISSMDTATVPGILYFISGYSQGQRNSGMGTGGDSTAGGTTGTTGTDTTGTDTTDTDTTDTDATGTDTTSSEGQTGAAAGTPQIGTITGYFEIPVQELLVACEANPDRPVSEMLDEEGQRQGAGGTTGAGTSDTDTDSDASNGTDASGSTTSSQ